MPALAEPFLADVHREVLPNGLVLLVRRDPAAPVVAVYTRVGSGYFDEPDDVVGIAHVLEHMYFKGTPTRGPGEIARQTRARGGQLNAWTTYDHTTYYVVLPSDAWREGLAIQADAYANSLIDRDELARELGVIIEEAKRKLDAPGPVATESFYALLFDAHRMRRWRIGEPARLRTFTRAEVEGFYRAHYRPGNTILAVVGDVRVDEVRDAVHACYGGLADAPVPRDRGPAEPVPAPPRWRDWTGDIRQAQQLWGWRIPGRDHADAVALTLVARVLGQGRSARLYRALRERELVTGVGVHDYRPGDLGVFSVHLDGPAAGMRAAAAAWWRELGLLRDEGVTEDEVTRLREGTVARWCRTLESVESQAGLLVEWEATGGLARGAARLDEQLTLGADRLGEVARHWLVPERASGLHYRPRDAAPLVADAPSAMSAAVVHDAVAREAGTVVPVGAAAAAPPLPAAVSVARAARLERVAHGVHVYRTTAGGVPLLVRRVPGTPMVHLAVQARGGVTMERPEEAGLARALVLAALKGVPGRDAAQLADAAERLGGAIGTTAGVEQLGWQLAAPPARLAEAARLLAAVVLDPLLPVETVRTEARLAIAELERARDDMAREPLRLALEAAWGMHPYARSPLGHPEALSAMATRDGRALAHQVRGLHRELVERFPGVLAVVGDADPDLLAEAVAVPFARLVAGQDVAVASPTWPSAPREQVVERDKRQTALALLLPGSPRDSEAREAGVLLGAIASGLGGRLFEELRSRRSLAYTVSAGPLERRRAGAFLAYIATSPEREDEARAGLLAELGRFVESPVTDEELARAQRAVLGARAIGLQGGGARLAQMVDAWLVGRGLVELDDVEGRLLAATPGTLLAWAREWLDPARVTVGVVRGRVVSAPAAP